MQYVVFFIAIVLCVGGLVLFRFFEQRKVKRMTYNELVRRCKDFINKGQFDRMQSFCLRHPMLLLKHFNELQTTLADYARVVEDRIQNKKEEG